MEMTEDTVTLTEAAKLTGHSREALRLRVRRGKLEARKGNDGILRIERWRLNQLPPPDAEDADADREDGPGSSLVEVVEVVTMLRKDLEQARTTADDLRQDVNRIQQEAVNHRVGREVAEARNELLEIQVATLRAELMEARKPWIKRVLGL